MSARFGWVTSGLRRGPNPICDQDLLNHPTAGVLPTLGSLLPGWLLVVPRTGALAIRDLPRRGREDVLGLARSLTTQMSKFGRDTYILEHGPSKPLSVVGCGVDQSHLHVLGLSGDLLQLSLGDNSVDWHSGEVADPWNAIEAGDEYLLMVRGDVCYVGFPHTPQSQYFRRKIAQIQGIPDAWDYREWPYYENVQRTIEHFAARHRRAA